MTIRGIAFLGTLFASVGVARADENVGYDQQAAVAPTPVQPNTP